MADEKMIQAQAVFKTVCAALDQNEWKYDKNEDELTIRCGVNGDDLPMNITVNVDAKRSLLLVFSTLPFTVSEDKRLDLAIAVSVVNNNLVDGSFDYDLSDGSLFFRLTNSFIESSIGKELVRYMIACTCSTVDDYNEKFLMLGKNLIGLEKFIELVSAE